MLSKDTYLSAVEFIRDRRRKAEALEVTIGSSGFLEDGEYLASGLCTSVISPYEGKLVEVLEEATGDTEGHLSYFLYDLDEGRLADVLEPVYGKNGGEWRLKEPIDVYRLLVNDSFKTNV